MSADRPASDPVASPSQTVGPFFHFGLATDDGLGRVAPAGVQGERILLELRVVDGDGAPVPDALIEIYQADAGGRYADPMFAGFGRLATDADGRSIFETVRPGPVEAVGGAVQAAHINVCLFARGLLRQLYTRVYFDGDPGLAADPLLALVSADRQHTLVASSTAAGVWTLTIRLQGENETVFFDL